MKNLYATALFIFISSLSIAQSNFKPGYIINLKGDTVRGFVDYKEWGQNPTFINFKSDQRAAENKFTTADIRIFEITGFAKYLTASVNISLNTTIETSLVTDIDSTYKTGMVFLKVLEEGDNLTLYQYRDYLKSRFYIKDNKTGIIDELIFRPFISKEDNNHTIVQDKHYCRQLAVLAYNYNKPSATFIQNIYAAKYYSEDLMAVVKKINNREVPIVSNTNLIHFRAFHFFAGAGVSDGSLSFTGATALSSSQVKKSSVEPKISAGADWFLNPAIRKLFIRLEANYYLSQYNLTATSQPVNSVLTDETINMKSNTIATSAKVVYNFYNGTTFKVFAGAGLSAEFSSYPTNTRTITQYYNTIGNGVSYQVNFDLRPVVFAVPIVAGVSFGNKIELNATYLPPRSVTNNYNNLNGNVNNFQFGVNYLF